MKSKKIVLFVFLLIGVLSLFLTYKLKQNNLSKNKPVKEEKLSIMIKEAGATDYTKSSSKDIPKGDYTLNTEKTYCENNGEVISYDNVNGVVGFSFIGSDRCTLYFDEIVLSLYKIIENRHSEEDEFVKLYNGVDYGDTTSYANNIYYFNGAVENNNALFGGYCWKIVRTTDTGGVKMIYNGFPTTDDYTLLNQSEYTNLSNDTSYPYTYDETNKTWTSTNTTGANSSTISFTVSSSGDYVINYDLSIYNSENYENVEIFKNDVSQGKFTGTMTGQIGFKDLTTSDVIKIVFTRKYSYTSGDRNNVIFSFGKANSMIKICNNTGTDTEIGKSAFNSSWNSPAYVGYMYNKNKVYILYKKSISNIIFGNSFTYANGTYTLTDTITINSDTSDAKLKTHHYSCLTNANSCTQVYYVYYNNNFDGNIGYIILTNGKSAEDAINEMLYDNDVNIDNSDIKTYIDTWYVNNMTNYTDKLEDTEFCYDRSISNKSSNGWNPNGGGPTRGIYFKNGRYNANTNYSLACENKTDTFTVNISNGNGALIYPVGLLTRPELLLASKDLSTSIHYLISGSEYWLASPDEISVDEARYNYVSSKGINYDMYVSSPYGVRPVISLKSGTEISLGDGSYTNPFVIN